MYFFGLLASVSLMRDAYLWLCHYVWCNNAKANDNLTERRAKVKPSVFCIVISDPLGIKIN